MNDRLSRHVDIPPLIDDSWMRNLSFPGKHDIFFTDRVARSSCTSLYLPDRQSLFFFFKACFQQSQLFPDRYLTTVLPSQESNRLRQLQH